MLLSNQTEVVRFDVPEKTMRLRRRYAEEKLGFRRADHKSDPDRVGWFLAKRRGVHHDEKMLKRLVAAQDNEVLCDLLDPEMLEVPEVAAILLDSQNVVVRTTNAALTVERRELPVTLRCLGTSPQDLESSMVLDAQYDERSRILARQRSKELARERRENPTSPTVLQWRREEQEREEAATFKERLSASDSARITTMLRVEFGARIDDLREGVAERLVRGISFASTYVDIKTKTALTCTVAATLAAKLESALAA